MSTLKKYGWVCVLVLAGWMTSAFAFEWQTDAEKALKTAKEENKVLLYYFTGSDWCGWCKRLKAEVLDTDEFKAFADEQLVCLLLDFPSSRIKQSNKLKKQNEALAKSFKVEGYPTVFLVGADEKVLLKTGYRQGGPASYIEMLKKAMPQPGEQAE